MTFTPETSAVLPAAALDGIADGIVLAAEPSARAAVIRDVIAEMYATVVWRQGNDPADPELISLLALVAEARAHHARMSTA